MKMKTLAELRRRAGFTQDSLAKRLGVATSLVSKWEQGVQMPNYDNLRKIRTVLKCEYDQLLEP